MTLASLLGKTTHSSTSSTEATQELTEEKPQTPDESFTPSLVLSPKVSFGLDIWNTAKDNESSYVGFEEKLGVKAQWNFGGKINPYAGASVVLGQASKNLKDPSGVVDNNTAVINRLGIETEFGAVANVVDNDSSQISVPFGIYTEIGKATGLAPFNTAVSDLSDLKGYAGAGLRAGVDLMLKGDTSDTKVGLYGQFGAREVEFHTPGYPSGQNAMVWGTSGGFGLSLSVTPHRSREEVTAPTPLPDSPLGGGDASMSLQETTPEGSASEPSPLGESPLAEGATAVSSVSPGTSVDAMAPAVSAPAVSPSKGSAPLVKTPDKTTKSPSTPSTTPGPAVPATAGILPPAEVVPAEPLTTITLQQGKVYTKTVDAEGITADQLKKAVYAVGRYNKSALSLKSCQQIGTTKVKYGSSIVTVPVVHMAIDFKVYKAQWVIAMLPARRSGDNIEIRWALIPHTENSDKTVFTGPYASKLGEYKGYHYLSYDVGGWKLEGGKLTYWVSSDPTGLPGWVSSIANNSGLSTNLEEMIKLAKSM